MVDHVPYPQQLASKKDPVEFITHICHFGLTYIICNCSNEMVSKGAVVGISIAVVIIITVIVVPTAIIVPRKIAINKDWKEFKEKFHKVYATEELEEQR